MNIFNTLLEIVKNIKMERFKIAIYIISHQHIYFLIKILQDTIGKDFYCYCKFKTKILIYILNLLLLKI